MGAGYVGVEFDAVAGFVADAVVTVLEDGAAVDD